jgi:hypothetical protein
MGGMMSRMIEFVGYDGRPIWVAVSRILAVSEASGEKYGSPSSYITIAFGDTSDDWIVHETVADILKKLENSQEGK